MYHNLIKPIHCIKLMHKCKKLNKKKKEEYIERKLLSVL